MFVQEAMHLQYLQNFMGAQGTLTTLYRTLFILLHLSMSFLVVCGSPMHSTSTMWCFPDNCDRIWQNPAYEIRAQCAFFSTWGKKCRSWVFVIFMSKNLSTNLCHRLWRLTVSYKGEISLHFDLPSLYSCRTRSPLLWALIRIPASRLSRYS